jgi:exodeoxyribonuclease-3
MEERDSFTNILAAGFTDTFRSLYPNKTNCYTYWSARGDSKAINRGWRLDYFIVSNRFVATVNDSFIRGDEDGSDHCPIGLLLSK